MARPMALRETPDREHPTSRCLEADCPEPVAYVVQTFGGWVPFCDFHSIWYRQRPNEYPTRRLAALGETR